MQRTADWKNHNQYFTPDFAVERALSLVPISKVHNIIDPAVGEGIFLKVASTKWRDAHLFGIDIDASVIRNLRKEDLPKSVYFVGDSLMKKTWKRTRLRNIISDRGFDLVVGNPPFSSRFSRIEAPRILSEYRLAHKSQRLMRSQAMEVLFAEIFVDLAADGGFIVIVLPDSILANQQYRYVREFILNNTKVLFIIDLPRNIFKNTSAKTSILVLKKQVVRKMKYKVQMSSLNKNGTLSDRIKISGNDFRHRMDYWYYKKLRKSSVKRVLNKSATKILGDFVVYCRAGRTIYGEDRKFVKRGLRFLHSTNVTEIGINYSKDEKFIKCKSNLDMNGAHAKVGDILVVRVGDRCTGRAAILASRKDVGVVSDCIFMIRVKNISPYFITIFLKTKFGKDWINLRKHGLAATCINKSDILSLPIPVVSKKTQQLIRKNYRTILDEYRETLECKKDTRYLLEKLNLLVHYVEKKVERIK